MAHQCQALLITTAFPLKPGDQCPARATHETPDKKHVCWVHWKTERHPERRRHVRGGDLPLRFAEGGR